MPSEAKSALSFRMSLLVAFVGCCQCASHSLDGGPPRRLTTHHAVHDPWRALWATADRTVSAAAHRGRDCAQQPSSFEMRSRPLVR
jgi:hypothetical protein